MLCQNQTEWLSLVHWFQRGIPVFGKPINFGNYFSNFNDSIQTEIFNPFASEYTRNFFFDRMSDSCKHAFGFLRVMPEAVYAIDKCWKYTPVFLGISVTAVREWVGFLPNPFSTTCSVEFQAQICKDGFIIHCLWCLSGRPGADNRPVLRKRYYFGRKRPQ